MVHSSVVAVLESGRNTRGLTGQVAGIVLQERALFPELMFGLWHVEGRIRGLAADAVAKVTEEDPGLLQPFKAEILGLMSEARPAMVRWHLAQLLPRIKWTKPEKARAIGSLREYLEDRSAIVQVCAMTSLLELAAGDKALLEEVADRLRGFTKTGSPAVKARARILLAKL
jgi:hypothetical protein